MNITKEETGTLTATIRVEILEEDYQDSVKKVLKDYQKKANMPGFRPGKVPFGMIQKMYGKAVIADEVNKILSENLNNYIKDNDLNIIGHPIANTEKTKSLDFEHEQSFEFFFDIGLSPEIDLELSDKIKVDFHKIKVDAKTTEKYLEDVKKRFGNSTQPEESGEEDIMKGKIEELDPDGNPLENGINRETSVYIDFVKTKTEKKKFTGKKVGDSVVFNVVKAFKNEVDRASLLGINKEELEEHQGDFRFLIEDIHRIEPAEVNEELFKKVFPTETIENEEQFMERLNKEIEKSYEAESDRYFMTSARDKLIETVDISLPDDFMKRWLVEQSEGKITQDQIDKEYDQYAKSLKWQLIQNKIMKDHDIRVEEEEIRQYVRNYFASQGLAGGDDEESKKRIETIVDSVLQNKEEIQQIYDQLYDQKIHELLKSKLKLSNKSVSYDDFIKLVTKSN